MGQAKNRQLNDPSYGKPVKVETWIEVSELTGKYLVIAKVEDYCCGCVSQHYKKEDAIAASKIVEREFRKYSRTFWSTTDAFYKASAVLKDHYEDDDEVFVFRLSEGRLVKDERLTLAANARWLEHNLLSKAVADRIDWSA